MNNLKTKTMKKQEFINSKITMSKDEYIDKIGHCEEYEEDLIIYNHWCYIHKDKKGYNMIIENNEYHSNKIEDLEEILWDWAKHEINQIKS